MSSYKYRLRKPPFSCQVVGRGGECVALPYKHREKANQVEVIYQGEVLLIVPREQWNNMAIEHRHQPNQFGGGTFLMSYFQVSTGFVKLEDFKEPEKVLKKNEYECKICKKIRTSKIPKRVEESVCFKCARDAPDPQQLALA